MPTLPPAIIAVVAPFAPPLSGRVWRHAQVLLAGTILAPAQRTVAAAGPLELGADETLERRRGAKIAAKGIYRDAVRSSRSHFAKACGDNDGRIARVGRFQVFRSGSAPTVLDRAESGSHEAVTGQD